MLHLFCLIEQNNGNKHIRFEEDGKIRTIIFEKNSLALHLLNETMQEEIPARNSKEYFIGVINKLRKHCYFKKNERNPSIFRPQFKY